MQHFSASPKEFFASPWRHRALIRSLVVREVMGRYRGSVLGLSWAFFHPVLMLTVYTFVFSVVFKARWNTGSDSRVEFALALYAGLLVFNLFSECITRAPSVIVSNTNYVKKVIFPLEVLPWVNLGAALFHGLVSLAVWLLFYLVVYGVPHATVLLLPLVVAPFALMLVGISLMLASLGVYLRDVGQVVALSTTVLMFLSPVFYPVSALPEQFRLLMHLNPLTPVIELARQVLMWGQLPDMGLYAAYVLGCLVCAFLGFAWFQTTRQGFADVL